MALNILLNGARGRMGVAIANLAEANDAVVASACDFGDDPTKQAGKCNVIIDFSIHDATAEIAKLAADNQLPLVIGTTGHSAEAKKEIIDTIETRIPVVWAGNFSIGVNTLNYLTGKAAKILGERFEPEVLEMHHHHKKDAPSGTAERLIEILRDAYNLGKEHVVQPVWRQLNHAIGQFKRLWMTELKSGRIIQLLNLAAHSFNYFRTTVSGAAGPESGETIKDTPSIGIPVIAPGRRNNQARILFKLAVGRKRHPVGF